MTGPNSGLPPFRAPFAPPDEELAAGLLADAARDGAAERRIDARARALVEAIRAKAGGLGGIEDFLHAYSLSTKEGLALMVLAEALLRVPDAATADRLIEDKLAAGRWLDGDIKSTALLVSASAWTLGIAARIIHPGETPETILDDDREAPRPADGARGDAPGDAAHRLAFRARTDHRGSARARPRPRRSFAIPSTCSARARAPRPTPSRYFDAYAAAIAAIGSSAGNAAPPSPTARPGISVKLSALHPRYEAISRERVLAELAPRLPRSRAPGQGARAAIHRRCRGSRPARTVARRHRAPCWRDPSLRGWDGFGLAVQAYQKRAAAR